MQAAALAAAPAKAGAYEVTVNLGTPKQ